MLIQQGPYLLAAFVQSQSQHQGRGAGRSGQDGVTVLSHCLVGAMLKASLALRLLKLLQVHLSSLSPQSRESTPEQCFTTPLLSSVAVGVLLLFIST